MKVKILKTFYHNARRMEIGDTVEIPRQQGIKLQSKGLVKQVFELETKEEKTYNFRKNVASKRIKR